MSYRLSLLEQMHVVRDDGQDLGRLMDVRSRARLGRVERAEVFDAEALLLGASGWLEQIGLRDAGARELPAKAVVAIESDRIIVRATGLTKRDAHTRRKKR